MLSVEASVLNTGGHHHSQRSRRMAYIEAISWDGCEHSCFSMKKPCQTKKSQPSWRADPLSLKEYAHISITQCSLYGILMIGSCLL